MPDGAIRCRPGAPSSPIHVRCAFTGKIGAMWVDRCRVLVCFTCPQRGHAIAVCTAQGACSATFSL